MTCRKEIADMKRAAEKGGWTITVTGGGHLKWRSPEGVIYFSPSSPSDVRGIRNLRSDLRRRGCPV